MNVRLVWLSLALAVLTACAAPAPPPAATHPLASRLPTRPVAFPLNGIDPCALLTADQTHQLGLAPNPRFTPNSDALGSPACQWGSATRGASEQRLAKIITRRAADYYLGNESPVQVVTVGGYGAVQTTSPTRPSDQDHCLVLVDVAAGQTLWTQYDALLADNPGITQQVSCARARAGAEAMVATLKALRKPAN